MKKIKLSCSACKSEVVYDKEKPEDDNKAYSRLHQSDCDYAKTKDRMGYVADFGIPVESEVLS